MKGLPIQAVLQGAGLISGLVQIEIQGAGRLAVCRIMLLSLEASSSGYLTDQFLFNVSSFDSEKKQILLESVRYMSKDGCSEAAGWQLSEHVESAFGRFYYRVACAEDGKPLEPGDTLIICLRLEDEQSLFSEDWFLDAPASTFDGFQAAAVIKFPGNKQMLAGGQFEIASPSPT